MICKGRFLNVFDNCGCKMDSLPTGFLCWLCQEVMARAQIIILHGHQLSAGHHYAMALIMQRCNELRHHCDTLSAALKTKHSLLLQTHQLLLCLEQVMQTCIYLQSIQ